MLLVVLVLEQADPYSLHCLELVAGRWCYCSEHQLVVQVLVKVLAQVDVQVLVHQLAVL